MQCWIGAELHKVYMTVSLFIYLFITDGTLVLLNMTLEIFDPKNDTPLIILKVFERSLRLFNQKYSKS